MSDIDLAGLEGAFTAAGQNAVDALAGWASGSAWVADHRVRDLPFSQADTVLGRADDWHCVIIDTFDELHGSLLLAMSSTSATALAADTSNGAAPEVASTLDETANILTSAYLNGLRDQLGELGGSDAAYLPSPPGRSMRGPSPMIRVALGGQGRADRAFIARTHAARSDGAVTLDLLYVPGRSALPFLELAAAA